MHCKDYRQCFFFRVQGKDYKKRAITRLPFKLAQEFEFGVAVYALCRSASRPSYVKIDSRTNEEVKTVTKLICEVGYLNSTVSLFVFSPSLTIFCCL